MTTSDNDHEALQALRRANAILAAIPRTWPQVLDRVVHVEAAVEEDPESPDTSEPVAKRPVQPNYFEKVEEAFSVALDHASGGFRDFLLDLQAQWEERKWLSPAQREALFKAAERRR